MSTQMSNRCFKQALDSQHSKAQTIVANSSQKFENLALKDTGRNDKVSKELG